MDPFFTCEIPVLVGLLTLGWLLIFRPLQKERSLRKLPFTRDLQHAPGEGCVEKIQEITDKLEMQFLAMVLAPTAIVAYIFGLWHGTHLPPLQRPILVAVLLVAALASSAWAMFRARGLIRERSQYRRGFLGERHTAQSIAPLAREGYVIFHDLRCRKPGSDETFNIDHALIGPGGVFVIETKTRSKRAKQAGRSEVIFDGQALDFGNYRETSAIDQTLANARTLSKLIEARTGIALKVTPILSLPGWWVIARTHQPIFVGNPEQIPVYVTSRSPAGLDERVFKQTCAFFDELTRSLVE